MNETILLKCIGLGAYASVYSNGTYAYKIPTDDWRQQDYHVVLREGILLRRGFGPPLRGLLLNQKQQFLGFQMDLAQGSAEPFSLTRNMVQQLECTLRKLHGSGWIHGDIKLKNILVFNDASGALTIARFCDFGLSQMQTHWPIMRAYYATDEVCTLQFRAPEYLDSDPIWSHMDASFDLWSFGIMLYHAFSGACPTYSCATPRLVLERYKQWIPKDISERLKEFADALEADMCRYVGALLSWNPSERRILKDILLPDVCHEGLATITHFALASIPTKPMDRGFTNTYVRQFQKVYDDTTWDTNLKQHAKEYKFASIGAPMHENICRIMHIDSNIAFKDANEKLFYLLCTNAKLDLVVASVIASMFVLYMCRPTHLIHKHHCAKLASISIQELERCMDIALVYALEDPSWSDDLFHDTKAL